MCDLCQEKKCVYSFTQTTKMKEPHVHAAKTFRIAACGYLLLLCSCFTVLAFGFGVFGALSCSSSLIAFLHFALRWLTKGLINKNTCLGHKFVSPSSAQLRARDEAESFRTPEISCRAVAAKGWHWHWVTASQGYRNSDPFSKIWHNFWYICPTPMKNSATLTAWANPTFLCLCVFPPICYTIHILDPDGSTVQDSFFPGIGCIAATNELVKLGYQKQFPAYDESEVDVI